MTPGGPSVRELIRRLEQDPELWPTRAPHPLAASLVLPDGSPAPDGVRVWAAFDDRWPSPYAERRSELAVADRDGVVLARPMGEVFRYVCVDSVRDELLDDSDTLEYLDELALELAERFPGHGVLLDPHTTPDLILWLSPTGPELLWYDQDAVDRTEPFTVWLSELLDDL